MAQTVEINGEVYSDVPSIEVPLSTSGTASFYDISDTTAGAEDVASGKYFYNSSGTRTAGTGSYVTDVEMYGSSVVTSGVAEIPDTIHVGTSAPSDPNVKIWLDTDDVSIPSLIDMFYPVGSIYMSVSNVSPSVLFGGTWQQIQDTFLLAAGTTYTAGNTGGEATHTLIADEIPSHTHNYAEYVGSVGWSGTSSYNIVKTNNTDGYTNTNTDGNLATLSTGGGQAHNNMPPYLVVYIWKRTA